MKKLLVLVVAAFLASPVWALTYMGPPTSNIKQGETLLGFDFSSGETDVEWSGYGGKGTLEDVETDLYLGKAGLGISNGFELFGRFGISEIEDLGNEFAWGVGTKATFGRFEDWSWGALFQITAMRADDSENIVGFMLNGDVEIYEFQVAVGPSYNVGGLCFYGGPFFHFIDGELDLEFLGLTASYDIEQKSEFGGYGGLAWNIDESTSVAVEYQATGDADVIALGLVHRFGI